MLAAGQLDEVGAGQAAQGFVGVVDGPGLGGQGTQPGLLGFVVLAPELIEEAGLAEGSVDGGLHVVRLGVQALLFVESAAELVAHELDEVGVAAGLGEQVVNRTFGVDVWKVGRWVADQLAGLVGLQVRDLARQSANQAVVREGV